MINNTAIKLYIDSKEKFGFVGDLHFNDSLSSRLDNYMHVCCQKLLSIGEICHNHNVRYLFFGGDIFHTATCTHECVNILGKVLLSLKKRGIRLFSIYGNHDLLRNSLQPFLLERTPLQTLYNFNVLEHVNLSTPVEIYRMENDDFGVNSVKITAVDFGEVIPVADKRFNKNILLAHMFFGQTGFLSNADENISREQMERYGYNMAFLGHDHAEYQPEQCGKTLVVRSGSLLRGTAHDYNFNREPGFIILDDIFNPQNIRKIVVPHHRFQDIISQTTLSKKTSSKLEIINKDSLQNLAEKLAMANEKDKGLDDVIFKIIKTDSQISNNRRELLLRYIHTSTR